MTTLNDIALRVASMEFHGDRDTAAFTKARLIEFIHAFIAELNAQGWQLVPKEPTDEMFNAMIKHIFDYTKYTNALKAAPKITEWVQIELRNRAKELRGE